jgi:fucose permease
VKQKNGNDLILVSAIIFASIAAILLATAVGDEVAEWIGGLFLMLFGLPFVTIAGVCLIAGLVRKARSKRMSPRSIA